MMAGSARKPRLFVALSPALRDIPPRTLFQLQVITSRDDKGGVAAARRFVHSLGDVEIGRTENTPVALLGSVMGELELSNVEDRSFELSSIGGGDVILALEPGSSDGSEKSVLDGYEVVAVLAFSVDHLDASPLDVPPKHRRTAG